jgi:hypothetical protein
MADISGYTGLLQSVTVAHPDAFAGGTVPPAYDLVSHLIDGIVERLIPPFALAKLEGDAVFAYGTDLAVMPHGAALIDCVQDCYTHFHDRLREARGLWQCTCEACIRIERLELKFVLHTGTFAIQRIAGSDELAGTDVVVVHRLLKNAAEQALGKGGYLLLSQAAVDALAVPTNGWVHLEESYEHLAPIPVHATPMPAASPDAGGPPRPRA